jgi:mRNA interferase RelE/StbE
MPYSVGMSPRAVKELADLPRREQARIAEVIEGLQGDPRPPGCRKLAGTDDLFRVRAGRLRVVYQVSDRDVAILVLRVADRSRVYRQL